MSELRVFNSLTREKEPFITAAAQKLNSSSASSSASSASSSSLSGKEPHQQHARRVNWYICGPTVYDLSHMGHARNYVAFDVIRRLLEDYFHYDVFSVMNITDVDDKIILKARRRFLFAQFVEEEMNRAQSLGKNSLEEILATPEQLAHFASAWEKHVVSLQKKYDGVAADDDKGPLEKQPELELYASKIAEARKRLAVVTALQAGSKGDVDSNTLPSLGLLIRDAEEPLASLLDAEKGHTVNDAAVFRETAAEYEAAFFEDMARLNIRPPDALTRVTEFIPEVVKMVEQIIANGFGYVADGSVYFDTAKFSDTEHSGHRYAKLSPESVGKEALMEEGEGSLGMKLAGDKRHKNDFCLWKKSKDGEPAWDSPWGKGRPGWHIECSAMAGELIGDKLDIHGGGQDLRFPHHDNEIAQSEAAYGCKEWVNYFLHSGHLHINGLKMSKSLKNFVTIRDALDDHGFSPRLLRLLFCLRPWNKIMNYSQEMMATEIKSKEKAFSEFFLLVGNVLRSQTTGEQIASMAQVWSPAEHTLQQKLSNTFAAVDSAFKDNFDTGTAIEALLDLVSATNAYVHKTMASQSHPRGFIVEHAARYVTDMLRVLGLSTAVSGTFGWGADAASSTEGRETTLAPFLDMFAGFRSQVRELAMAGSSKSEFMTLCDDVRDTHAPALGLRLEDSGAFPWKLVDGAALQAEIAEKKARAAAVTLDKARKRKLKLESDLARLREGQKTGGELFQSDASFSKFDASGMPTHDADGKELAKSAIKKASKSFTMQQKKHAALQKALQKDPRAIENAEEAIRLVEKEIAELSAHLQ